MNFFKNVGAIFIVQLINQILPLALIPYLTRILGIEVYGVYAYIMGICFFAAIILDFGFNIFGVERVSKRINYKNKIKVVYSNVVSAKILILCVVILSYIIYAFFNDKYAEYYVEFIIASLIIFSFAFQPYWVFMGLEKMVYITISVFLSRLALLLFVIICVKNKNDLDILIFINGVSQFLVVIATFYLLKKNNIYYIGFNFKHAISYIKKSFEFFISRVSVAVYSIGGGIFLGLFSTPENVAIYSIADQMYKGAQALISPVGQVMYPYMIRTKNFVFLYKVTCLTTCVAIVGIIFSFFVSREIIELLFGIDFLDATQPLYVLLCCIVVTTPSVLFGYPLLGARGFIKKANESVIFGGLSQVIFFILIYLFFDVNAVNVAFSILFAEIVVFSIRIYWGFLNTKTK